MTIAIVDDFEPDLRSIANDMKNFLEEHNAPPPHFTFYSSGGAFIDELSPHCFDFILLDCCMAGMSGLETAKELRKKDKETPLIFITSCQDYAIDGYLVNACGYLIKPYTYETFSEVFEAVYQRVLSNRERILLLDGGIKHWFPAEDIVYCDIDGHYSQIHFCNNQIMRIRMTFSSLLEQIQPYPEFLECFRGCIINMSHIQKVEEMGFLMSTGERVPYRKKEKTIILTKYSNYLFEKIRSAPL